MLGGRQILINGARRRTWGPKEAVSEKPLQNNLDGPRSSNLIH